MIFFDESWVAFADKENHPYQISKLTGVDQEILIGTHQPHQASVAQRMSWAARRRITRVEDRAYCLVGLFGLNMPLLYGEGAKAFARLQEEIIKSTDDETVFAWSVKDEMMHWDYQFGILAQQPECFRNSSEIAVQTINIDAAFTFYVTRKPPYAITHKGLQIQSGVLVLEDLSSQRLLPLRCIPGYIQELGPLTYTQAMKDVFLAIPLAPAPRGAERGGYRYRTHHLYLCRKMLQCDDKPPQQQQFSEMRYQVDLVHNGTGWVKRQPRMFRWLKAGSNASDSELHQLYIDTGQ